jgi:hypothetical protein
MIVVMENNPARYTASIDEVTDEWQTSPSRTRCGVEVMVSSAVDW